MNRKRSLSHFKRIRAALIVAVVYTLMPFYGHATQLPRYTSEVLCESLLSNLSRELSVPIPQAGQLKSIQDLTGMVFKVTFKNGSSFAMRLSPFTSSAPFEKYVADYLLKFTSIYTPPVRVLNPDEGRELLDAVNRIRRSDTPLDIKLSVTLAPYLERSTTGTQYFLENRITQHANELMRPADLKRIPESLRRSLVDIWALLAVLGVHDFHANNFLVPFAVSPPIAVPIDLGLWSEAYLRGLKDPFQSYAHNPRIFNPFQADGLDASENCSLIASEISPEMRAHLAALTPELIVAHAKSVGFLIEKSHVRGTIARAHFVARGCREY